MKRAGLRLRSEASWSDRPLTSHRKRVERIEVAGPPSLTMSTDDELARVLIERLARLGFALVPAISDVSIAGWPGAAVPQR